MTLGDLIQPPEADPGELVLFERFCSRLVLEDGRPFVLESFQREMLRDYFAGVVESIILIPKKNGKSTLLAALALFHLLTTPDAECVIAAASRDQATILFDQAAGFVRRTPALDERVKIQKGYRQLVSLRDSGRIRVLASDVDTADGVIPTLALVDELHRHKSAELYGVFRDGLGPRAGRMLTISTAGTAADSPLGLYRQAAHELVDRQLDGRHLVARSPDRQSFVFHEWALLEHDDVADMQVVKLANPASWQTEASLLRRFESPSTTPWQWARFACGLWTEGEEPWFEPAKWDGLRPPGGAPVAIDPARPAFAAVDIGVRHDSTGIVVVQALEDNPRKFRARGELVLPDASGAVSLDRVETRLLELAGGLHLVEIGYDPWSFRRSAELLEARGLPMTEFPQSPERMSLASAGLYAVLDEGRLEHDGDPLLRAHVLAGTVKNTERGWRLVKDPKLRRPIDLLIALAMAIALATDPPDDTTSREAIFF